MNIFGYQITKIKKVKLVIIDTRSYKPRIDIRLEGDGWAFSDQELGVQIENIFNNLPEKLTLEEKVQVFELFFPEDITFKIIE